MFLANENWHACLITSQARDLNFEEVSKTLVSRIQEHTEVLGYAGIYRNTCILFFPMYMVNILSLLFHLIAMTEVLSDTLVRIQ